MSTSASLSRRLFASTLCRSCRRALLAKTPSKRALTTTHGDMQDQQNEEKSMSFADLTLIHSREAKRKQQVKEEQRQEQSQQIPQKLDQRPRMQQQQLNPPLPSAQGAFGRTEARKIDPVAVHEIYGDFNRADSIGPPSTQAEKQLARTYRLGVYATKHNTHLTLSRPNGNPMLSLSTGNIGFRKANRGTFDAAFQLACVAFRQIQERGMMNNIVQGEGCVEVVLRGFGIGREAITKAIMGVEGQPIRKLIVRVTDSTRLKFGGTRSKKPRRLG